MKKLFVLALIAFSISATAFAQNTLAQRVARSNSDIQLIETWYGWRDVKAFPDPSALRVGDVVENPGIIAEATHENSYIKVWIKEVDPETGYIIITPIRAQVFGYPNWRELSNPTELIPITVKLEVLPGGTKKYWAWFGQPDYTLKASLHQ